MKHDLIRLTQVLVEHLLHSLPEAGIEDRGVQLVSLTKLQRSRLVEPIVDQRPSITAVLAWRFGPRRS